MTDNVSDRITLDDEDIRTAGRALGVTWTYTQDPNLEILYIEQALKKAGKEEEFVETLASIQRAKIRALFPPEN